MTVGHLSVRRNLNCISIIFAVIITFRECISVVAYCYRGKSMEQGDFADFQLDMGGICATIFSHLDIHEKVDEKMILALCLQGFQKTVLSNTHIQAIISYMHYFK